MRFKFFAEFSNGELRELHPTQARLTAELNSPSLLELSYSPAADGFTVDLSSRIRVYDLERETDWVDATVTDGVLKFAVQPDWADDGVVCELNDGTIIELTQELETGGFETWPELDDGDYRVRLLPYRSFDIVSATWSREGDAVVVTLQCNDAAARLSRIPVALAGDRRIEGEYSLVQLTSLVPLQDGSFKLIVTGGSARKQVDISAENYLEFLQALAEAFSDADYLCYFTVSEAKVIRLQRKSRASGYDELLRCPGEISALERSVDLVGMANVIVCLGRVTESGELATELTPKSITIGSNTYEGLGFRWVLPDDSIRSFARVGDIVTITFPAVLGTVTKIERFEDEGFTWVWVETSRLAYDDYIKGFGVFELKFQGKESYCGTWFKAVVPENEIYFDADAVRLKATLDVLLPDEAVGKQVSIRREQVRTSIAGALPEPDVAGYILAVGNHGELPFAVIELDAPGSKALQDVNWQSICWQTELDAVGAEVQLSFKDGDKDFQLRGVVVMQKQDTRSIFGASTAQVTRYYISPPIREFDWGEFRYLYLPMSESAQRKVEFTFQHKPFYAIELTSDDVESYVDWYDAETFRVRLVTQALDADERTRFGWLFARDAGDLTYEDFYYHEDGVRTLGHLIVLSSTPSVGNLRERITARASKRFPFDGEHNSTVSTTGQWSAGGNTCTIPIASNGGEFIGWTLKTNPGTADEASYTIKQSQSSDTNTTLVISGTFSDSGTDAPVKLEPPPEYFDFLCPVQADDFDSFIGTIGALERIIVTKITASPLLFDLSPEFRRDIGDARISLKLPINVAGYAPVGVLGRVVTPSLEDELEEGTKSDAISLALVKHGDTSGATLEVLLEAFQTDYAIEAGSVVAILRGRFGELVHANVELAKIKSISEDQGYARLEFERELSEPVYPGDIIALAELRDKSSVESYGERIALKTVDAPVPPYELFKIGLDELLKRSQPSVTYNVTPVGIEFEPELGKRLRVVDEELDLDVQGLVVSSYQRDLLAPEDFTVSIGELPKRVETSVAELERLLADLNRELRFEIHAGGERCVFWDDKLKRCLKADELGMPLFCYSRKARRDGRFRRDGLPITKADCPYLTFELKSGWRGDIQGKAISVSGEVIFEEFVGTRLNGGWKIVDELSFIGPSSGVDFRVVEAWVTKLYVIDEGAGGYLATPSQYQNTLVRVKREPDGRIATSYNPVIVSGLGGAFVNSDSGPYLAVELSNIAADELTGWWAFRIEDGRIVEGRKIISNDATDNSGLVFIWVDSEWTATGTFEALIGLPAHRLSSGKGFIIELNIPQGERYTIAIGWEARGYAL